MPALSAEAVVHGESTTTITETVVAKVMRRVAPVSAAARINSHTQALDAATCGPQRNWRAKP